LPSSTWVPASFSAVVMRRLRLKLIWFSVRIQNALKPMRRAIQPSYWSWNSPFHQVRQVRLGRF